MADTPPFALVALDLDGTALSADGTVSPRLKAAIAASLERGVQVILATGRMPQSATRYWLDLKLPPGPLIAFQGAMVVWQPDGRVEAKVNLPDAGARLTVQWALSHELLTQVYVGSELWVSREAARVRHYIEVNHIPALVRGAPDMTDWPEPPVKVLLQDEGARLDRLRGELEHLLRHEPVRVFKSQVDYLEVVHQAVGKSVGLAAAAKALGVDQSRVFAVGDAENDIDMLEWAGMGVAMGQAPARVKNAANAVTDSLDNDGCAKAIERWVLGDGA